MTGDTKKLKDLIKIAKKQGLSYLKVGEIEFRLEPIQKKIKPLTVDEKLALEKSVEPPDDEMLYYSTEYYDELKEQRTS